MAAELCDLLTWERLEPRLRRMNRMLARRHRGRIVRVARALLSRTSLSARELDRLAGRSVNDVQPNISPGLLAIGHAVRAARDSTS
jgi:hypothetical protein